MWSQLWLVVTDTCANSNSWFSYLMRILLVTQFFCYSKNIYGNVLTYEYKSMAHFYVMHVETDYIATKISSAVCGCIWVSESVWNELYLKKWEVGLGE